jgi:CheY-like chemotaxis protein
MSIRPLTILLAEDNQDHAELIIDTLKDFNVGNTIVHVNDGEKAIEYLKNKAAEAEGDSAIPDLVLLDLKMPRMDGASTLRAIREDYRLKHLPVVMVSTSTVEKEINTCFELGANSYVTKPLQFEEFSRKIKDLNLYWVLTSELPK